MVSSACVRMASSQGPRSWTFDHIAGPGTSQEAFFAGAENPPYLSFSGLVGMRTLGTASHKEASGAVYLSLLRHTLGASTLM